MKGRFLEEVSTDSAKYDRLKKKNQAYSELLEPNVNPTYPEDRYHPRLASCSDSLRLALTMNKRLKTLVVQRCKTRDCPICEHIRLLKNMQLMLWKQSELQKSYPNARYIFLTLTVPNCPISELRATVQHMAKSWKKLIENLIKTNSSIFGFVRKLETTRNSKTNEIHPHYHILLQVSPSYFSGNNYIKHEEWLSRWQKATGNERITQVNVQAVKKGDSQALLELFKYELKAAELGDGELEKLDDVERDVLSEWLAERNRQMRRIRAYSSGGTLKMTKLEEVAEPEEEIEIDDKIIAQLRARFDGYFKKYRIENFSECR